MKRHCYLMKLNLLSGCEAFIAEIAVVHIAELRRELKVKHIGRNAVLRRFCDS